LEAHERGLLVARARWTMSNRDAGVQGKVAWTSPRRLITRADAGRHGGNGNAANARINFPRERIAAAGARLADRAFVRSLSRANVVLRGPIRHFPFRDGTVLFLARCALDGLTLDYAEGWPRAENLPRTPSFATKD